MKLKKIGALLITLCMLISCIPQTIAGAADSGWIAIEGETGASTSQYATLERNDSASNGGFITVFTKSEDVTVDWEFEVSTAGKFDIWVLAIELSSAPITFSLNGGDALDFTAGTEELYKKYYGASSDGASLGWTGSATWCKIASGVTLAADKNEISASFKTTRSNQERVGLIDVIRVVPTEWGWEAGADLSEPEKQEISSFDVEVETGTLTKQDGSSGEAARLSDPATGRGYIIANGSFPGLKSTKTFTCFVTGSYDIWAVVGVGVASKYLGGYTFTLDDEDAFYSEYMSVADEAAVGNSLYTSSQLTGGSYHREMKWVKIASEKTIQSGEHTLVSQITESQVDSNRFGTIDVVRFVPSDWMWTPDSSFADASPAEWVQVEAENGTLSDKCSIVTSSGASGGKYVSFESRSAASTEDVQTVTMKLKVAKSGTYDMWIIAGRTTNNSVVPWTFTLDGNTYTQPNVALSYTLFANYGLGWGQEMFWSRPGTGISLEAGKEYTLVASVTSVRGDLAFLQGLDVVRFVPTSWYWGGTDNVNPPSNRVISPDRDGMVTIEPENGIISGFTSYEHDKASNGKYLAVKSSSAEGSSLAGFKLEKSGPYDIWAAVATIPGDAGYLGGYKFTLDETDVIYSCNLGSVSKDNPDLYGETIVLHEQAVDASASTVRWVKLADEKALTSGTHTLLSATNNPGSNKTGLIDCVYIVPSEWEWVAGDSFRVDKGFKLRDESYAWVEGEEFIRANTDAASVSVGVAGGTPSGGSEIYRGAFNSADAQFAPSFTFDVYVDEAGSYKIWNYGYMYSSSGMMHCGKMTATVNDTSTTGASDYQIATTDGGTDGQTKKWNRLENSVYLVEGKNTITVTYTYGGTHNLFCTDAVAIVPESWNWAPTAINANYTTVVLDALAAQKSLEAQTKTATASDLTLADRGAAGSTITYTSTNSAISNLGAVTIPTGWYGGDAKGTITATATKGALTASSDAVSTIVNVIRPIEYEGITFLSDFTAGSAITAKITGVTATSEEEGLSAIGVIAVYKNGDIDSVNLSGEKEITTTAQTITASTTLPEDMTGVVVKGFLWTGLDTIIPISNTISYATDSAGYDDELLPLLKAKYEKKNVSGFNLGIITDVQSSAVSGYRTYNHHYQSIVKASKFIQLDALADLGDMIMGSDKDRTGTAALLAKQSEILSDANVPTFRIKGNHDDNRWAAATFQNANYFIDDNEWTELCSVDWENTMDGTTAGVKPYYYKDFPEDKIRIIAMDTQNIPYTFNGNTSVAFTFGFEQAQLDWLANEALNFSDKTDKDEWGVIFLMHALSYDSGNTVINFAGFGNIINAFMNGTKGTYSNTHAMAPVNNLAYDFTEQGEMEIICIFNGHTHVDGDGTMWGVKYISTGSSLPDEYDSLPDRSLYSKNEDLWDIMTIDRQARKIYATRFGAGEDREFTY